jgi:hypothetical protein
MVGCRSMMSPCRGAALVLVFLLAGPGFGAVPASRAQEQGAVPVISALNIERVTLHVDGEEGEHAELSILRSGRVQRGPTARGRGSAPTIATRVSRVPNRDAFFAELALRLNAAGFAALRDDPTPARTGMWRSIEVRWAGRSHTLVLRPELQNVTTLVTEALGMTILDL